MKKFIPNLPKQQNGMVLIIALIILLAMTTIGVSSISTTTLEERMAGNFNDRNLALQSAEAALRDGERFILKNRPDASQFNNNCTVQAGLCDYVNNNALTTSYWMDATIWSTANRHRIYNTTLDNNLYSQPKYIIEFMGYTCGEKTNPADPDCWDEPTNAGDPARPDPFYGDPAIYRVTALGYGQQNTTTVMLQSTFTLY